MANELVKVELFGVNNGGDKIRWTIADGASVSQGTLLTATDPRTAISATAKTIMAGVAAEEHVADKGDTSVPVWQNGVFRFVASGSITVGDSLVPGGAVNKMTSAAIQTSWTGAKSMDTLSDGETGSARFNL